MSLKYKEKMRTSKRTHAAAGTRVSKTALSACIASVFGLSVAVFGSNAFAQSVTASTKANATPPTLEQAQAKSKEATILDPGAAQERDLRAKAMQEAAQSYGARSGLLRRSFEIRNAVEKVGPKLDAIWNFRPLMLTDAQPGEVAQHRERLIVPPVAIKAEGIFKQDSGTLVRFVNATYKLTTQPRFASVSPTWREYLYRDLGETVVQPPHVTLLPRTDEERANWDRWVAEGWAAGVKQADAYYEYDLNRLQRDFNGMAQYHEMVAKNMVSLPHVATANESVTGDENTLNINDSLLRITVMPAFRFDTKNWKPLQEGR